jgi:hypothetical protein
MSIHRKKTVERSDRATSLHGNAAHLLSPCLRVSVSLGLMLFLSVGCSVPGQSTDVLIADARSRLVSAKEYGAEHLAKLEFEEAEALLAEAEAALENRQKGARSLIEKAYAKARLAEALARQSEAEAEAMRLETELEKASQEANIARQEREAAESELGQDPPE